MSAYNDLKQNINANVKQNGQQEITGPVMNQVLNNVVEKVITAEGPEEYQGPEEGELGDGYYTKAEIDALLTRLQEKLVSGYNIKTVNLASLLGSGNIEIPRGQTGAQGDQGNSGYDGTGLEVVNNLTQGGATAALSAEMGKRLAEGYQYLGIATPSTDPGVPTHRVFYIASEPGTYHINFENLVVNEGEVAVLKWNGSWTKETTGVATAAQLNQLGQSIGSIKKSFVSGDITEGLYQGTEIIIDVDQSIDATFVVYGFINWSEQVTLGYVSRDEPLKIILENDLIILRLYAQGVTPVAIATLTYPESIYDKVFELEKENKGFNEEIDNNTEDINKLKENVGFTITHNYTHQYETYNVNIPIGTTIVNKSSIVLYIIYEDTSSDILYNGIEVKLSKNVAGLRCNEAGEGVVEIVGLQSEMTKKYGYDILHTFTTQYESYSVNIQQGKTISILSDMGLYIYYTDNTYDIVYNHQSLYLKKNVASIKCDSVGSMKVHVLGDTDINVGKEYPGMLLGRCFHKIGCIGDSYTEGYIQLDGESAVMAHDYSYPYYLSKITGNIVLNYGKSGTTAKDWATYYFDSLDIDVCQAYIIGLGINDAGSGGEPAGIASDIGTDNDTFTAYLYKVIQKTITLASSAKVFVCTEPRFEDNDYNVAIRNVCAYCRNAGQQVYLCELTDYYNEYFYGNPFLIADQINGHYTALGYEMFAECILRVISDVMKMNISDFQNLHKLPYD